MVREAQQELAAEQAKKQELLRSIDHSAIVRTALEGSMGKLHTQLRDERTMRVTMKLQASLLNDTSASASSRAEALEQAAGLVMETELQRMRDEVDTLRTAVQHLKPEKGAYLVHDYRELAWVMA